MARPGKMGQFFLASVFPRFHNSLCQIIANKRAREECRIPAWDSGKYSKYCIADFSVKNAWY